MLGAAAAAAGTVAGAAGEGSAWQGPRAWQAGWGMTYSPFSSF